jgi:hypothetical protein
VTPSAVIRHIASLPELEVFQAGVPADLKLEGVPYPFPALREMRLREATVDHLSVMLPFVRSSHIHTLELGPSVFAEPKRVGALLHVVAAHASSRALRVFLLRATGRTARQQPSARPSAHPSSVLTADDIRPLMGMTHLHVVELGDYSIDGADGLVACTLHAWPELEVLILDGVATEIPLADFLDVARTHPFLHHLPGLFVTHSPGGIPSGPTDFVHRALRSLCVQETKSVEDRALLARLLVATFPNLTTHRLDLDLQQAMKDIRRAFPGALSSASGGMC